MKFLAVLHLYIGLLVIPAAFLVPGLALTYGGLFWSNAWAGALIAMVIVNFAISGIFAIIAIHQ